MIYRTDQVRGVLSYLFEPLLADRILTERSVSFYNVTEQSAADIRMSKTQGLLRSGCPPLKISRSGADFVLCVTERGGSDIRLCQNTMIVTERILAATIITERCG